MGEDKEAQQVALENPKRTVNGVCVGWGEGYLRPKIYILMPCTRLAYGLFDKICVSALRDAPNHIA